VSWLRTTANDLSRNLKNNVVSGNVVLIPSMNACVGPSPVPSKISTEKGFITLSHYMLRNRYNAAIAS
jgi:hypothetical protein